MRYYQREESKCSMCMEWFQISARIAGFLNVCEACVERALTTDVYILPNRDGVIYRLLLVPKANSAAASDSLQRVHSRYEAQITAIHSKWRRVQHSLNDKPPTLPIDQWIDKQLIRQEEHSHKSTQCQTTCPQIIQEDNHTESMVKQSPISKGILSERNSNRSSFAKKSIAVRSGQKQNNPQFFSISPFVQQTKQSEQMKQLILQWLEAASYPTVLLKIMMEQVYECILNTKKGKQSLELVRHSLEDIDVRCYLDHLVFDGVKVFKLVKNRLTTAQFRIILEHIRNTSVQTLVVTNNALTDDIYQVLVGCEKGELLNIYLGNNHFVPKRVKKMWKEVENKFNIFY